MARYVALLRAVNVAGHARIPGDELRRLFAVAGARDISSFGHAGNVLFTARGAASVIARVRAEIDRRHGERCVIVVRPSSTLAALAAANPFAACAAGATDKLYVSFLSRQSAKRPRLPLVSPLERLTVFARHGREVLLVSGRKPNGFYGFPNALVEEAFGVPATTRNWSTVRRLAALLAG